MGVEMELKFQNLDLSVLRERLLAAGARCQGWTFERNIIFDLPDRSLREQRKLLRLRVADAATLTFKRPLLAADASVKSLEEIETRIHDAHALRALLAGLGYLEVFCYEKVRAVWTLENATICLDRLPFGDFAEIELLDAEGGRAAFADLASRLGLDLALATSKSYHELHRERRERLGLPPDENFIFPGTPPSGADLCWDRQ